jgi:chromosome segregation ATPase
LSSGQQAYSELKDELDAANARIAELTEQRDSGRDHAGRMMAERDAALARIADLEDSLQDCNDDICKERDAANARAEAAEHASALHRASWDAAEEDKAALRAEVERLRADREAELDARGRYGFATVEQLAAANALLVRCQAVVRPVSLLARDLDSHLAAQPAAAPVLNDVTFTSLLPTRTETTQPATAPSSEFLRGVEWARGNPDVGWPGR